MLDFIDENFEYTSLWIQRHYFLSITPCFPVLSSIEPTSTKKLYPENQFVQLATEIITKTRTIQRSGRADYVQSSNSIRCQSFISKSESHELTFLKRATTRSILPENDDKPNQMSKPNSNKSSVSNGSTHFE